MYGGYLYLIDNISSSNGQSVIIVIVVAFSIGFVSVRLFKYIFM